MIAITHPIKQMINSQYGFLSSMIDFYPNLMNEWIEKQKKEVEQLARDYAEGDYDVYRDTYNSEISRVDSCYEEELLFNQAMLIMVYSYYESFLYRFAKECNVDKGTPSNIAAKYGKTIGGEYLKISEYLFNKIHPLRNQVCHNNQGTLFSKSNINEIKAIDELVERKYISIDEGRITFIDRIFLKNVLDDEHKLLLRLAEICGFKTKWYSHKDGKMVEYDNHDQIK